MSRRKKYTIWIIILLVAGVGIYFFVGSRKTKTEYTTETASRGNLAQTVSITGEIKAENQADVSFKGTGRLISLQFEVGNNVKEGDKMAEIDKGGLYIDLQKAREDVTTQEKTLLHMREHESTYSDEQISAQKAVVRKAQEAVRSVFQQISETAISAPISGVVARKNYNIGENITVNGAVYTIIGEGGIEIEADIPESDIVKVSVGQGAAITLDALPSDEELEAEVTEIEPASTVIQDVVYYKAKLKLKNNDERLKIGMSTDIDIRTAEKNNVVIIPLRAVKTEGEKEYVEILKTTDKVESTEKVFIKTGLRGDEGMVEVVSGLSGGEKVVTLVKTD